MSAKGNVFTQTDVLLTIAGVLENARELSITHPDSLRQLAYQHRVISAENFFRFNEPLVQGCILRCASSLELDYSNLSGESDAVAAYLISMIHAPNSSRAEALYEFLLALATERLRLDKKDFEQVVENAKSIDWCKALLVA